jgi:hypothetical protein
MITWTTKLLSGDILEIIIILLESTGHCTTNDYLKTF